jgi:hypothetical protein
MADAMERTSSAPAFTVQMKGLDSMDGGAEERAL